MRTPRSYCGVRMIIARKFDAKKQSLQNIYLVSVAVFMSYNGFLKFGLSRVYNADYGRACAYFGRYSVL
jgi:hypothetical protein